MDRWIQKVRSRQIAVAAHNQLVEQINKSVERGMPRGVAAMTHLEALKADTLRRLFHFHMLLGRAGRKSWLVIELRSVYSRDDNTSLDPEGYGKDWV